VGIGWTLEAIKEVIKDDKLGTFKFLFSLIFKIICSIAQQKRFVHGYPHLTAPRIVMKWMKNINLSLLALAPGFLMESDSLSGKQTLVFFGFWERVSLKSYLNLSVK
jgi:hypothetical protein